MRRIVFANRKGGCGKTTLTINIGASLSELGKKVLIVDLDSQAHSSYYLGFNTFVRKNNLFELFNNFLSNIKSDYNKFVHKTDFKNLFLIPSSSFLNELKINENIKDSEFVISNLINNIDLKPDFILFDTSPVMDIFTKNSFIAANEVMIPVEMHPLSVKGLAQMIREIYLINNEYNKDLIITGIIPTLFNQRTKVYNAVLEELKKIFPSEIIFYGVRYDIKLAEAPDRQKPVIYYAPISRASYDFKVIARKILRIDKEKGKRIDKINNGE